MNFSKELTDLINRCSKENESNTPDFILAQYIEGALAAFTTAVQQRETWYGRDARPSPSCGPVRFFVNGDEVEMANPEVNYETLARMCGQPEASITWRDTQGRRGIIHHGHTLHVTPGMNISVITTGNA